MWLLWLVPLPAFIKGGLASDEQRGLMHADRVWPGKDGACLSVLYLRVGEEQ